MSIIIKQGANRMSKRIIVLLLSTVCLFTFLMGCGRKDADTKNITVWVAENVLEFTKEQIAIFQRDNPEYAVYNITVQPVGENDASINMTTDVEGGADIFGFAQDQIARLVSVGALMPITEAYKNEIEATNDDGAVSSVTVGNKVYAFPLTSDNGYFLYYDKSIITNPESLEQILSDCEKAGKNFYMQINSGWYQAAFFFGAGCQLTYETDTEGRFTQCNASYASENGVKALKAMIKLHKSSAFVNGSSVSDATNAGAIVDGTWDAEAAKNFFGENYACEKLPSVDMDGELVQLGGFGGYKLLGIKPQEDFDKMSACLAIANYLSGQEVQFERYKKVGWGPSNKNVQSTDLVHGDQALMALANQLQYTIPQGNYPQDFWLLTTALGDDIISGKYDHASDSELLQVLKEFQATCESFVKE